MSKELFGVTQGGENIYKYTLKNSFIQAEFINFGASVYSVKVPDKNDKLTDVVLMPESLYDIEKHPNYMGATVGRYANRIKNAAFEINDKSYTLYKNDSPHSLHGGMIGFDKKIWKADETDNSIIFSYFSKDGEEGYPGNLNITVKYILDENSIIIEYLAESDEDTVINLTNHSYFNLNGHSTGKVSNHTLKLNSDFYLPVDETIIPTGEILKTANSKFDFKEEKPLSEYYDHCFILSDTSALKYAGTLKGDISNIKMNVYTTKPGIQIYRGKSLSVPTVGKGGEKYVEDTFVCMETEFFPDSPNHSHFTNALLKKGDVYKHKTIYEFN